MMPCGWEGNRRSGIALATRHRYQWFSTFGLKERDMNTCLCSLVEHGQLYFTFMIYTWKMINKGKGMRTFDMAPLPESQQKRSGMARVLERSVLPAHQHVYPQSEWAILAFAFPAIAGTHLPTPEGWKAELAWVAVRQFACPKAVTHPRTNRAQCRATALIETNVLPLH